MPSPKIQSLPGLLPRLQKTLVNLVQSVIRRANSERVPYGLAPIHLRWCSDDLFSSDYKQRNALRQQWSNGYSLTLVDSVSMFHPGVWSRFQDLPEPKQSIMNALIWLPPYTFHTWRMVELVDEVLGTKHIKLHDRFNTWRQGLRESADADADAAWEPYLAFDVGNDIYLWRLLYQMLTSIGLSQEPDTEKVRAMDEAFGDREAHITVSALFSDR